MASEINKQQELVNNLLELGFEENKARVALEATNFESVEAAATWLVDRLEEEQECEETTELPTSQQIPLRNILSNFVQSHLGEEHKMVIVARKDIKMGHGKMAAQVAHGAVGVVLNLIETGRQDVLDRWRMRGQAKIVVRADSEKELYDLQQKANALNIPNKIIRDAGRTQLESGTATVLAVGPAPASEVDKVTGGQKLY